jgi:hypothetical protein
MRFDDIRWNELEPVETPSQRRNGEKKAPVTGAVGGSGVRHLGIRIDIKWSQISIFIIAIRPIELFQPIS